MQTKRQKQETALNNLLAQLEIKQDERASLQCQAFGLIAPYDEEIRLAHEINTLKVRLGMDQPIQESPF